MSRNDKSFQKFSEAIHLQSNDIKNQTVKEKDVKTKSSSSKHSKLKNDQKTAFYINQRTKIDFPHSLLPEFNVGKTPVESFQDFQDHMYPHCTFTEPRPLYFSSRLCDRVDRCYRRLILKENYRLRILMARTKFQTAWKNNRNLRKQEKDNIYHPSLFTLAERLENNPDPFFYGNYDYYYTGGNICTFSNENGYILHVDGENLSTLKLSKVPFKENVSYISHRELCSLQLKNQDEIFEIRPLQAVSDKKNNLFGVRQLMKCKIMTLLEDDKKLKPVIEFNTKCTPFISFAQSFEKPEYFVLSTMKQHIRIYDLSKKVISVQELYKMQDKEVVARNNIIAWENQTFLYANEHQICVMDFRTSQNEWLTTGCTNSLKDLPCDLISFMHPSHFNNLFYIGSNHSLNCLDIRGLVPNRSFKNSSICEWVHQLDYPPAFIDTFINNDRECIALGSGLAGDFRICELTHCKAFESHTKDTYKSHCLPYQPPTLEEAYQNACLNGKVLQPEADLKHRIRCCITGITFINRNKYDRKHNDMQALLLQTNSNGDIYVQTVKERSQNISEQRISNRSNEVMADYATNLCKLPQPALNYTDIVDLKAMQKVLLCEELTRTFTKEEYTSNEENEVEMKTSPEKRFKGRWQKPVSTLKTYKDALAADLLSIWDVPLDEGTDIKLSDLDKKFGSNKTETDILSWLNGSNETNIVTTIPASNLNKISFDRETTSNNYKSNDNITQEYLMESYLNVSLEQNNSLQNNILALPKKPKISKAKKKHIKGF